MNDIATAEYTGEVARARIFLRDALNKIKARQENNSNQARSVDLRDEDNIATLAMLWETSNAFGISRELVQPALDILDQLDAFHAGFMHGAPAEDPMAKRAEHLEDLIAKAADEVDLAADPKYDTTEGILAYFVQQVRARKNLSNAIKGAADDMGYGEVKSVEAFVRESREKLAATRQRAEKERAALEQIAGALGLEVKPGAAAEEFVTAVRNRINALEDPLPAKRSDEPFRRGELIAGQWVSANGDNPPTYVGRFLNGKEGQSPTIERPFHQDDTDDPYWRLVTTNLNAETARLATDEERKAFDRLMTEGGFE